MFVAELLNTSKSEVGSPVLAGVGGGRLSCAALLVECGYRPDSAHKMVADYVRKGVVSSTHATAAQLLSVLEHLADLCVNKKGRRWPLLRQAISRLLLQERETLPDAAPTASPVPEVAPRAVPAAAEQTAHALEAPAQAESSVPLTAQPATPPPPSAGASCAPPAATSDEAAELCALLQVDEAVLVRTIGQGATKLFSLVDVARLVSGKTASNAQRDVQTVLADFSEIVASPTAAGQEFRGQPREVSQSVRNFETVRTSASSEPYCRVHYLQATGQGQRRTPFADLRGTLLLVLRLRSRAAQRLSARIVDVFVRYVGGDFYRQSMRYAQKRRACYGLHRHVHCSRAMVPTYRNNHPDVFLPVKAMNTMASALSAEDALERVLGGLTEENFASVRISHSVPGAKGPHVAALDIIKVVTKTNKSNATQRLGKLKNDHPEVFTSIKHFQFPGQGQSRIDVVDLPTALQIIMVLQGKIAGSLRLKASVLLVRCLAGDLTLVGEIYGMNALQEYLAEHCPDHPLAKFREAATALAETSSQNARKRALESELVIADLESRLATVRREATVVNLDAYERISKADSLDDRERIALRARITSGIFWNKDSADDERVEINLTDYLRKHQSRLDPKAYGRALAKRWRERHPGQAQPTKRMVLEN